MSHASGITVSQELADRFAKSHDASIRAIKVSILDEKLVEGAVESPSGSWEDDFDKTVLKQLEEKRPCYILYRTDNQGALGYEWILICYVPDWAPVREKMIYASTRSSLRREFADGRIKDELFGTTKDDVSLEGYRKHVKSQNAPPPPFRQRGGDQGDQVQRVRC
eukprot:Opistho-2@83354